jgi:hypoxanthine phosphoribosyltransferase
MGINYLVILLKNYEKISWSEVERLVKILSEKINSLPRKFSSISTISRGGLVPARLLADHLDIDVVLVDQKKISSESIFVDDIYDSGDTFKKIITLVDNPSKLLFATLFARRGKKYPRQLIYAKKTRNNSYIVYPWDKLEYKRFERNNV